MDELRVDSWIELQERLFADAGNTTVSIYAFPAGGSPFAVFKLPTPGMPSGIAITPTESF